VNARQVLGGRYRLEERLGEGGMSVVWQAFDIVLGRQVAVKVLSGRYATDDQFRESILAEAQAAARVTHPHLASVHDYGESLDAEGRLVPYVVMELLSGPTLNERLASGPLPPRMALRICAQIAEALGAAHDHYLVHRDVKPGNIMVTAVGAKLVDFGVAAVAGAPGDDGPDGRIMGTPNYVAPERLVGGPVEPASDVYGLGVLMFRVLTGHLPWPSGSLSLSGRADPAPLPSIDGMPDDVKDLYLSCVAIQPAERPSAHEVAARLTAAVSATPDGPTGDNGSTGGDGPTADTMGDQDTDPQTPAVAIRVAAPAGLRAKAGSRTRRAAIAALSAAGVIAAVVATVLIVSQASPARTDTPQAGPPQAGPSGQVVSAGVTDGATSAAPTGTAGAQVPGEPVDRDAGGSAPYPLPTATGPTGSTGSSGPTTPAPTTPAGPTGRTTFSSAGGSVVAVCYGPLAYLESWEPAAGYEVMSVQQGPAAKVAAAFRSTSAAIRIVVECEAGVPQARTHTDQPRTPPPTP